MNTKRITQSAALGLALAALATPAFGAQQDLRNADQVTAPANARQDLRNADQVTPPANARHDLRNADQVTPRVTARQDLRSPDAIDAAAGRGSDRSPDVMVVRLPVETPATATADGLDWQDAGIGAGGLFALGLIGLGGTLVVVHRRRGVAPTPGAR
jgi:hypothetical protein